MDSSRLVVIFLILFNSLLIQSSDVKFPIGIKSEFKIYYNNKNSTLSGHLYFDENQGNVRIDYNIQSKSYVNEIKKSATSYFYNLDDGSMFEITESKCSKYKSEKLPFPLKVFPNAINSENLNVNGKQFEVWSSVSDESSTKNIQWYINSQGIVEKIKVSTSWGDEMIVEFSNIESLYTSLVSPTSVAGEDASDAQLYCDRITEKFSAQSKSCQRGCSNRGLCIASDCYCYHGFEGKDCSILPEVVPEGICGNGVIDEGEECDDGNSIEDDCCSNKCKVQRVGNSCISGNPCRMPFGVCSASGKCESDIDVNGYCTDDNACTNDVCVEGECVSTPKELKCDLSVPLSECNTYHSCDPKTGNCLFKQKDDGTRCTGSSSCTGLCNKGRCEDITISCNNTRLCHESFCDSKTGSCFSEPLKDGSPCMNQDGCKYICHSGMCLMADSNCPQLSMHRTTNLAIIVYPEQRYILATSELLKRWSSNENARISIISNNIRFPTFDSVREAQEKLNSINYDNVEEFFLRDSLEKATRIFSHDLEGNSANALIVFSPILELDKVYFDEQRGQFNKKSIELFVISSSPKFETFKSMFTYLEDRHYIGNLNNDDENIQSIMNIISEYPSNKRDFVARHICGNGIVDIDEECDSDDPCCVDCFWKTCPNQGCKGDGTCVAGRCEYAFNNCEFLNTQCLEFFCEADVCLGVVLPPIPCDDGNACSVDDTCINGECVGEEQDCASVFDECIEGICNPFTGQCEEILLNNTSCLGGICENGVCVTTPTPGHVCDPSDPHTGTDGICCLAGEQEEIADCASSILYSLDCVVMSWCSGGFCEVDLKPLGTACSVAGLSGFCDFDGRCII